MMLQMENDLKSRIPEENYKDDLLQKLRQASTDVRSEMDSGMQPDEYQKADKLLKAIEAAMDVVTQE